MDKTENLSRVQSALARKRKRKKGGNGSNGSSFDNVELFLLHLPTTIWYLVFCYAPIFGIVIAFMNYQVSPGKGFLYSLFINSKYRGLGNFRVLIDQPDFHKLLYNTLFYNVIFIILGVVVPVTLAIMISQLYSKKLAKVCQTMMFLPHFLSWVVIGYFVYAFLATDHGLFNHVLPTLGISEPGHRWYLDTGFWRWFLIFLNQWKGMGYGMVVYLASISGIDAELYEAALIDGASKWKQTRYITIPLLRPIISIMLILSLGSIFRSDFGLFYQATRNSVSDDVSLTIDVYVYRMLLVNSNINYSSSSALLQSICGCIMIILSNVIVRHIDPEASLF